METSTYAVRADVGTWTRKLAERAEALGLDVFRVWRPHANPIFGEPQLTTEVTFVLDAPSEALANARVIRLLHADSIIVSGHMPTPEPWARVPALATL